MKLNVDWTGVGFCVLMASWGISGVVDHLRDADRLKDCDRRGGEFVKVSDSWGAEKACRVPSAKP